MSVIRRLGCRLHRVIARPRTSDHVWLMAIVFVVAFVYQWGRPTFLNDHMEHMAQAQAVLHGEYPVRDFFDSGRPLTIALSALALHFSRGALLGEAILTMGAIAVSDVLVYWLTFRLSGSLVLALWAAACAVAVEPRLYSYPKVLACVVGAWLTFRYVDRPTITRAVMLGAWGGIGFLFRHDLGVYVAVIALTGLLVGNSQHEHRHLVGHGAAVIAASLAIAGPYIIFLARQGALASVASSGGEGLVGAARVTWRAFVIPSTVDAGWLRYDAENWIYDIFLLTPVVAAGAMLARRSRMSPNERNVWPLATLCFCLVLFLIRGNLDSRLPDIAAPSLVLLAWLASFMTGGRNSMSRASFRISMTIPAVLVVFTTVSIWSLTDWFPPRRLASILLRLPSSVTQPYAWLREDPLTMSEQGNQDRTFTLARWMRDCTRPDQRLLIFGYYPEAFFYSNRLFAGGMVFLHSGYFSAPAQQQLAVRRLEQQDVPFVVIEATDAPMLDGTYSIIGRWVRTHYRVAAVTGFNGKRRFTIYEANSLSTAGTAQGLPCVHGSGLRESHRANS